MALLDDSEHERAALRAMMKEWSARRGLPIELREYAMGGEFLRDAAPRAFDLALLDILGVDGMGAARRLYERDPRCKIVFLTVSPDFLAEGYQVRAVRYLLKPVRADHLADALDCCARELGAGHSTIEIVTGTGSRFLSPGDVRFITSSRRRVELHLESEIVAVTGSLAVFCAQARLPGSFLPCYRGVLVNAAHAVRIDGDWFVMDNGERAPISRRSMARWRGEWLRICGELLS